MEQSSATIFECADTFQRALLPKARRDVNTHAYTVGTDICLVRPGSPDANEGRRLIAHELTHVVQIEVQRRFVFDQGG